MIHFDKDSMIIKLTNEEHPFCPSLKKIYDQILVDLKSLLKSNSNSLLKEYKLIFIQTEDIEDSKAKWIDFILHSAVRFEIEETILSYFNLLSFIQTAPVKVYFFSKFDLNSLFLFFVNISDKVFWCKSNPSIKNTFDFSYVPRDFALFINSTKSTEDSYIEYLKAHNKISFLPLKQNWIEGLLLKVSHDTVESSWHTVYDFSYTEKFSKKVSSYFFSKEFYLQSTREININDQKQVFKRFHNPKVVYIDLEFGLLPLESLVSLLRSKIVLCFFNKNKDQLPYQLKDIKESLETKLHKFEYYWNHFVFWSCYRINHSKMIRLGLESSGDLRILHNDSNMIFSIIDSLKTEKPWVVFSSYNLDKKLCKEVQNIANKIFAGILISPVKEPCQISFEVRSLFFDELLHICQFYQISLTRCLRALKKYGWTKSSSFKYWEAFYKQKYTSLELLSHKELDFYINLYSSNVSQSSVTFVSMRMMVFTSILAFYLLEKNYFNSIQNIDLFLHFLLGTPKNMGLPFYFINTIGHIRLSKYCEQFWPQFNFLFKNMEKKYATIIQSSFTK